MRCRGTRTWWIFSMASIIILLGIDQGFCMGSSYDAEHSTKANASSREERPNSQTPTRGSLSSRQSVGVQGIVEPPGSDGLRGRDASVGAEGSQATGSSPDLGASAGTSTSLRRRGAAHASLESRGLFQVHPPVKSRGPVGVDSSLGLDVQ